MNGGTRASPLVAAPGASTKKTCLPGRTAIRPFLPFRLSAPLATWRLRRQVLNFDQPALAVSRREVGKSGRRESELVKAFTGPAVPACPERASRTGGTLVVDAFFVRAADNPIGHDDRLGSGLLDERQHFFRHPDIVADVGLLLREPASKVGRLGILGRHNADRELGRDAIVRAVERDSCEASREILSWPSCSISCAPARSFPPSAAVKIAYGIFPNRAEAFESI